VPRKRSFAPDQFKKVWVERFPSLACRVQDHRVQCLAEVRPLLRDRQAAVSLILEPAGAQLADVGRGAR
jgi:hypothetical protein